MAAAATSALIDLLAPLEQEGTKAVVLSWLKSVGEAVGVDEPLVELETDKVAVEIPAPCSGVLVEQTLAAGEDAAPGAVLGRLRPGPAGASTPTPNAAPPATAPPAPTGEGEHRLSPSVRRLLKHSGMGAAGLVGTGRGGRLTREDVADEIARRASGPPVPTPPAAGEVKRIPHDAMRRRIAEHMTRSLATAPHVTAVFEADFSAIIAHRAAHKPAFERQGASLTFTAYIVSVSVQAMAAAPTVNSRWREDHLEVFGDINIGVGVALGETGLIAPVIHKAQDLSLLETARELQDLSERARTGKLKPADVQGGTFSISNHGVSGSLLAAPIIINQPQSAILGVGKLEKRVVVRTVGGVDSIQIRPMAFVSLSIDHRALDGAQTNAWLTRFVEVLETWPEG